MPVLNDATALLDLAAPLELRGAVTEVRGLVLCVDDLPAPVGATVRVTPHRRDDGEGVEAEVIGFDHRHTLVMPLGSTAGIHPGDRVTLIDHAARARVGHGLLGRVLHATGQPIDDLGSLGETVVRPLHPRPVDPLDRPVIDRPLATGVRAIDALTPLGRGQRLGVFAAAGVGKSTLLGMMARRTAADVSVIALIGERGREVREFVERTLGDLTGGAVSEAAIADAAASLLAAQQRRPRAASGDWRDPWDEADGFRITGGAGFDAPILVDTQERIARVECGPGGVAVRVGAAQGEAGSSRVVHVGAEVYAVEAGRSVRVALVDEMARGLAPEDAGRAAAPMHGRIVALYVAEGDRVVAGDSLYAIEAMKMEHTVKAGAAGTVEAVRAGPGDQVGEGEEVVVLRLDEGAEGAPDTA